ncbi:MAG: hypothetical protein N3D15_08495 [Syntrophorhabdaceae bacterium]|nr:hypothetical protein [Syntrophorhabdaceae bacterium]
MDEIATINIGDFKKQPDGTWVVAKISDIITKDGNYIRLAPGMFFKQGSKLWGFDIVKILDELSQHQKTS